MTASKTGDISSLLMLEHLDDGVSKAPRSEGFSPRKYSSELLTKAGKTTIWTRKLIIYKFERALSNQINGSQ